ncbi:hypothetical protein Ae406Ps2_5744 [Pseudonocardia sp. Ae406_Ps2]|nr:hypothetical protein Ae331Ps2_0215c [Pseudonocardia sp. Ae331_Ps2]OLM05744.1 hypothetical protein Ae406Ps2_5744 [Pseudonocardia sp. Ae406_Ps2]OLM15098.1 hypothetical protein Ae505Ps2_5230c [Pseudonocardia sp. Ae505_Ps2]OLM27320.1 hypothetical protein Ae706Ps2_5754 [Pseudonocardia sp. Ae706_Ps2]
MWDRGAPRRSGRGSAARPERRRMFRQWRAGRPLSLITRASRMMDG